MSAQVWNLMLFLTSVLPKFEVVTKREKEIEYVCCVCVCVCVWERELLCVCV